MTGPQMAGLLSVAVALGVMASGLTLQNSTAQLAQASQTTPNEKSTGKQDCEPARKVCLSKAYNSEAKCKRAFDTCVGKDQKCSKQMKAVKGMSACNSDVDCQRHCTESLNTKTGMIDCCKGGPQVKPSCLQERDGQCINSVSYKEAKQPNLADKLPQLDRWNRPTGGQGLLDPKTGPSGGDWSGQKEAGSYGPGSGSCDGYGNCSGGSAPTLYSNDGKMFDAYGNEVAYKEIVDIAAGDPGESPQIPGATFVFPDGSGARTQMSADPLGSIPAEPGLIARPNLFSPDPIANQVQDHIINTAPPSTFNETALKDSQSVADRLYFISNDPRQSYINRSSANIGYRVLDFFANLFSR